MFGLKKILRKPYEPADMRICGLEAGVSLLVGSKMEIDNNWSIISVGQPVDRINLGDCSTESSFVDFSANESWTCTFE